MYAVEFFIIYKHNESTWRGVTSPHPIPKFPVEESHFNKNPHNYRRLYSISSYDGGITVKIINAYDLYIKNLLGSDQYVFYKDLETEIESKSFDNLDDAFKYLKEEYNVKIRVV